MHDCGKQLVCRECAEAGVQTFLSKIARIEEEYRRLLAEKDTALLQVDEARKAWATLSAVAANMFQTTSDGSTRRIYEEWRDSAEAVAFVQSNIRRSTDKRKCVVCGQETGPGDPRCMQCLHDNKLGGGKHICGPGFPGE